jgi:hypothetical protein
MTWIEFFAEPTAVKYLKPGDEVVVSEGASLRLYTVIKVTFKKLSTDDAHAQILLHDPRRNLKFEITREKDWDFHRVVPDLFADRTANEFKVDIETSIVKVL